MVKFGEINTMAETENRRLNIESQEKSPYEQLSSLFDKEPTINEAAQRNIETDDFMIRMFKSFPKKGKESSITVSYTEKAKVIGSSFEIGNGNTHRIENHLGELLDFNDATPMNERLNQAVKWVLNQKKNEWDEEKKRESLKKRQLELEKKQEEERKQKFANLMRTATIIVLRKKQ